MVRQLERGHLKNVVWANRVCAKVARLQGLRGKNNAVVFNIISSGLYPVLSSENNPFLWSRVDPE